MKKHLKDIYYLMFLALMGCNGKSTQEPTTLKGRLVIGHGVSTFRPCGSTLEYWITDESLKLDSLYAQITNNRKPSYQEVYCEIKATQSPPQEGFSSDYEGVLSVKEILKVEKISLEKDCQ